MLEGYKNPRDTKERERERERERMTKKFLVHTTQDHSLFHEIEKNIGYQLLVSEQKSCRMANGRMSLSPSLSMHLSSGLVNGWDKVSAAH